ncbi:hypothetical protein EYD00_02630 [Agrobacterium sp. 33MFTa1.1]|nr:hypothetical protein EYD00_02630 [Agrobacterium sp. 33MFTa1.1]
MVKQSHPRPRTRYSARSSRRASERRGEPCQRKDLGWLDSWDRHSNEGGGEASACDNRTSHLMPYVLTATTKRRGNRRSNRPSAIGG